MTDAALVLGGTGFIGAHLVRALAASGREVVLLARTSSSVAADLSTFRVVRSDDWSPDALSRLLGAERFDTIFNLASYGVHPGLRDPLPMHSVNVDLPVTLASVAADHGARLILAGSSAEYARPRDAMPLDETQPLETRQIYGATKAAGGLAASAVANALKVPSMVLRLFNVYGPGEAPHRLAPSLLAGLSSGKRVALSPGIQLRDFIFVGDVVDALLAADRHLATTDDPFSTPVANVATGRGTSVREFCTALATQLGADASLLGFGDHPMRAGEVPCLVGDARVFGALTGWSAKTSLEAGIGRLLSVADKPQSACV